MLNLEYTINQFKNRLSSDVDNQTLGDLYILCRDNFIPLKDVNKFVNGFELISLDKMLHSFNYRTIEDVLDTEPVIRIGDRWIV